MGQDFPSNNGSFAALLDDCALYGVKPGSDEPDYRPLPELTTVRGELDNIFDSLATMVSGTKLEDDLPDLFQGLCYLFHHVVRRFDRELDEVIGAQRASASAQDGSEVRSVELETLIYRGRVLEERRSAFEACYLHVLDRHCAETGRHFSPDRQSVPRHLHTAAMIESRDFIAAVRAAKHERHFPRGRYVVLSGSRDGQDHMQIWAYLDRVLSKLPDMVLVHGGMKDGADAEKRKIQDNVIKLARSYGIWTVALDAAGKGVVIHRGGKKDGGGVSPVTPTNEHHAGRRFSSAMRTMRRRMRCRASDADGMQRCIHI